MSNRDNQIDRRLFLGTMAASVALADLAKDSCAGQGQPTFQISLNESSFDRSLRASTIDHLDLARIARDEFEITAVEYVSRYFKKNFTDEYLTEMNRRSAEHEVLQLLIVVDREGHVGDMDANRRDQALWNHRKWIRAAKTLGCHSIQVDPRGPGARAVQLERTADGLSALVEYAAQHKINVLVGQSEGHSRDAQWLVELIERVARENCRVMPRFGGFGNGDRYAGMQRLAPLAKAISANSCDFDELGNESNTDFQRMMKLVVTSGYGGYVGIEYGGKQLDERAGVRATAELLKRARASLS